MCQHPPNADEPSCQCEQAVKRAYKGLIAAGEPENIAMTAAKRVYKHHHPEESAAQANLTVERWVAGSIH